MKKIISLLLIASLILCACGKKDTEEVKGPEVAKDGFYLNYNGYKLELNKEFTTDSYGEYNNSFENENCAFGERDVTYFYDDLEVETYGEKTGPLTVYSIKITGDNGKTNEGIGLYDSIDDMVNAYGEGYEKNDNKYKYVKNNTELVFITENDLIVSIEYLVSNLG